MWELDHAFTSDFELRQRSLSNVYASVPHLLSALSCTVWRTLRIKIDWCSTRAIRYGFEFHGDILHFELYRDKTMNPIPEVLFGGVISLWSIFGNTTFPINNAYDLKKLTEVFILELCGIKLKFKFPSATPNIMMTRCFIWDLTFLRLATFSSSILWPLRSNSATESLSGHVQLRIIK